MLTIFSAPKPFTDPHIATIQRNAIASWRELPGVRVLLLGDEPGLKETAQSLGVMHLPEIPRAPSGAPRMDAMFRLARQASPSPFYAIVNADIILFADLLKASENAAAQAQKFVLMGQRWDADIRQPLSLQPGWQEALRHKTQSEGSLHRPAGSDYFLFPAACYEEIPPFTIGRAGWENWMIYPARQQGYAALDATADVLVIHQNHDYAHLPGGKPHYKHPETEENIRLAGGRAVTRFTLLDANLRLQNGKIRPQPLTRARFWRQLEAWALLGAKSPRLANLLAKLRKKLSNLRVR